MKKKKIIESSIIIFVVFILIIVLILSIKKIVYEINYTNKIDSILEDTVEIEKKWIIDKENMMYKFG